MNSFSPEFAFKAGIATAIVTVAILLLYFFVTRRSSKNPNTQQQDKHNGHQGPFDITQSEGREQNLLNALEEAKTAHDAKLHFLAMVSHEIRTPLNGVIGMAQLLRDSDLQPAQRSYVEAIMTSGHSLNHLVDDLLDTAQIESGHSELCPRPTNITNLVEGVTEILSSRARDNGLALATFVDPQIPQNVDVDSGRLRQVLLNLAGNAAKFTAEGGVAIQVRLADTFETGPDEVDIQFCIADSGPGIAKEDQLDIFNEFVQLDDTATRSHGGAGLGLAISQNIIKLMGGTIRLQSELGKGARFLFNLKLPTKSELQATAEPSDRTVSIILPRTPARQAIAETTKSLGFVVETFDNLSSHILESHGKRSDHSVIVAHEGLNASIDTLHQLRNKLGDDAQLLLLGDAVQRQQVDPLLKEGFNGWLTWPVRSQTLSNVLNQTTDQVHSFSGQALAPRTSGIKMNVLLAEDNQINALLARALFSNLGHQVTHVLNGQEAVDSVVSNEPFDFIFMDLHMPVMDGKTAIAEIRAHETQTNRPPCPIIVLSADGQADVRDAALSLGANNYLTKPLNVEDLAAVFDSELPRQNVEKMQ